MSADDDVPPTPAGPDSEVGAPGAVPGEAKDAPTVDDAAEDALVAPPLPPPPSTRRPDRAQWALIAGAVVLALLGVGLLGWAFADQTGAPPAPAPSAAAGPPPPSSLVNGPPGSAPPGRPVETGPIASSSPPATLRIPAIRVDSPVEQVGLNPDRTMEVPAEGSPGYDHAAWFRYSVTPGRQGPSVIIGHVDSAEAGPSVFFELGRLRPGERVEVVRADGVTVTFEVAEVAVYPKDAFPGERVYGPTAGPELRLITCGGSFDSLAGSYRDNTVVYAREVP